MTGCSVVSADSVVVWLSPPPPVVVDAGVEVGEPFEVVVAGVLVGPLGVLVGVASVDVGVLLSAVVEVEVGVEVGVSLVLVGVSEVVESGEVVDDEVASSVLDEVGSAAAEPVAMSVPIERGTSSSCLLTW